MVTSRCRTCLRVAAASHSSPRGRTWLNLMHTELVASQSLPGIIGSHVAIMQLACPHAGAALMTALPFSQRLVAVSPWCRLAGNPIGIRAVPCCLTAPLGRWWSLFWQRASKASRPPIACTFRKRCVFRCWAAMRSPRSRICPCIAPVPVQAWRRRRGSPDDQTTSSSIRHSGMQI